MRTEHTRKTRGSVCFCVSWQLGKITRVQEELGREKGEEREGERRTAEGENWNIVLIDENGGTGDSRRQRREPHKDGDHV